MNEALEVRRKNLVIIDGNNMCWRGFKRAPLTSKGKNVDLVYMSLRMVFNYFSLVGDNGDLIIVWDGGRDKRRLERFPEYKRKPRPYTEQENADFEEYKRQQGIFKELIREIGISQILCKGREADDVINTIVKTRKVYSPILRSNIGEIDNPVLIKNFKVYDGYIYIVSNDLDYSQLLEYDNVAWYNPNTSSAMFKVDVYNTYGFYPSEYPVYKAIVGKHDNIPGVNGVGPTITQKYLEAVRNGNEIDVEKSGKVMKKLISALSLGELSTMIEISGFLDVPVDEIADGVIIPKVVGNNVIEYGRHVKSLLAQFEFDSIIDKLQDSILAIYQSVSNDNKFGLEV